MELKSFNAFSVFELPEKKILYKRESFYLLVKKTEACYDKTHIMVDNTEADGDGESHGRPESE